MAAIVTPLLLFAHLSLAIALNQLRADIRIVEYREYMFWSTAVGGIVSMALMWVYTVGIENDANQRHTWIRTQFTVVDAKLFPDNALVLLLNSARGLSHWVRPCGSDCVGLSHSMPVGAIFTAYCDPDDANDIVLHLPAVNTGIIIAMMFLGCLLAASFLMQLGMLVTYLHGNNAVHNHNANNPFYADIPPPNPPRPANYEHIDRQPPSLSSLPPYQPQA